MRIHALCLIKNEADIIREGLAAALLWCDYIYVFDNGSTDGTWEIVQNLAEAHPQILPYRSEAVPFRNSLRADIFNAFADRAGEDDWWCRLDADEFYVDDPRAFLGKVPARFGIVWNASLTFYFSSADAAAYHRDPSLFADVVPVSEKCRYYYNQWSEVRFVRHHLMAPWPKPSEGWPPDLFARGLSYPVRILAKHYPYRSPKQIEQRLSTRAASALSGRGFRHETIAHWARVVDPRAIQRHKWKDVDHAAGEAELELGWESRVIDVESLHYDAHDGRYVINEDLMPAIPQHLQPRTWRSRVRDTRAGRTLRRLFDACLRGND